MYGCARHGPLQEGSSQIRCLYGFGGAGMFPWAECLIAAQMIGGVLGGLLGYSTEPL